MLNIKTLSVSTNLTKLIDVSFTISSSTALVGQSGSGKSLILKSILKLLPNNLTKTFQYSSDFDLTYENIGFIPQNPFTSLSPLTKIKNQFFCDYEKQVEMLKIVNLDLDTLEKFPAQLSGGQCQRVILAIVLSKVPKILLLDEPTTALDKQSSKLIIDLIKSLQNQFKFLILFVTHDILSVKDICNDIIILKDGKIVENGSYNEIINNHINPYTKKLINSNFQTREYRL